MKNIFFGSAVMVCGVLFIIIVMTLSGRQIRQDELNRAVDNAIKETVDNQFDTRTYSANNTDEFVADFIEALLVQINSDSTIEINVLDADYEKGLLSVEVISHYLNPIGTKGKVSVERMVIMEQFSEMV